MEAKRYLEEDFNDFLKDLIDNKRFSDSKEEGIASLILDKGFDSLSNKQKFVLKRPLATICMTNVADVVVKCPGVKCLLQRTMEECVVGVNN